MISSLNGQCSTRSNAKTTRAAEAARQLQTDANRVASSMLQLDGKEEYDLHLRTPDDVCLARPNPSGYKGLAVRSPEGEISRLDADNGHQSYEITNEGQTKTIHYCETLTDQRGDRAVATKKWLVSGPHGSSYREILFWDSCTPMVLEADLESESLRRS